MFARLDDREVALLVVAVVVATAVFVLLALAYEGAAVSGVDDDVARWVGDELPTWVEWPSRVFSWVGGWIGLVVGGMVMGVVLLWERAWIDLGFLIAAFAGSQLVASGLKSVFDRPRPDLGSAVPLPESDSFPSGHAAAGTACVGALAVLVSERIESRLGRIAVWAGAVVLSLGIGLSRIALGVHWLSDVLAGWAFGIAWLALCLLVREAVRRPR